MIQVAECVKLLDIFNESSGACTCHIIHERFVNVTKTREIPSVSYLDLYTIQSY